MYVKGCSMLLWLTHRARMAKKMSGPPGGPSTRHSIPPSLHLHPGWVEWTGRSPLDRSPAEPKPSSTLRDQNSSSVKLVGTFLFTLPSSPFCFRVNWLSCLILSLLQKHCFRESIHMMLTGSEDFCFQNFLFDYRCDRWYIVMFLISHFFSKKLIYFIKFRK